ncbi:MAG: type VI secretion system-associated protein TagF [Gemmobacter sp.]|nr:type VI secretion system-associated protein TagF [Gemmobacter sp.]
MSSPAPSGPPSSGYGAYGKIPALGDFLRVSVDQRFIDPWDRWLQSSLVAGQAALGDDWQDHYMSAPIWRFTLPPGVCGPFAVQGVMMPSVDRVGRMFPLTLVSSLPGNPDVRAAHMSAGRQFDALESLALDALDDTMSRATLAARLSTLPAPALSHIAATPGQRHGLWTAQLSDQSICTLTAPAGLPSAPQIVTLFAPRVTP